MSSPRSVRFDAATVSGLAAFVARHPGLTSSSAAALLVEEGLRMDTHPGVVFREGPSGRRAGVAGGPDVWEVVRAIRDARTAESDLGADDVLAVVAENAGLPYPTLRVAVGYYGSYPDEVDALVAEADRAEDDARRSLDRTRQLLGT